MHTGSLQNMAGNRKDAIVAGELIIHIPCSFFNYTSDFVENQIEKQGEFLEMER